MIPLHESSHGILSPTKYPPRVEVGIPHHNDLVASFSDVSFEISNVTMICISYYPTLWLMFIYLYFMILHVGKDTTHLQYCATASWHWQMTNPPVTSLQKMYMYTPLCTKQFARISLRLCTNQRQSLEMNSAYSKDIL